MLIKILNMLIGMVNVNVLEVKLGYWRQLILRQGDKRQDFQGVMTA